MAYEPELERLERRYQDDPARNFAQLAETYRKVGRLDDALTLLRGHLADRPNYVSGLVVLGRCLLDQHEDGEAREVFERVLGVDAEHIIALRALGEIAERGGQIEEAKGWFGRLLDVDPMNEDAEAAIARLAAMPEAPAVSPAVPAAEEPAEAGPSFMDEMRAELAEEPEPAASATPPTPPTPASLGYPEPEAVELAPLPEPEEGATAIEPEYVVEEPSDVFMPRPSGAASLDFEQIGHLEISSKLPEEESLLSVPDEEPEEPGLPMGEREVHLWDEPAGAAGTTGGTGETGETGETAEGFEPTAAEPMEEVPAGEDLGAQPFDDALGWGAGERVSRQISREDIEEAEHLHDEAVETPVQELPGLETAEMPAGDDAAVPAVDGLESGESLADVVPLEGLEPTRQDMAPAGAGGTDEALPYLQTVGADDEGDRTGDAAPVGEVGAEDDMPVMLEPAASAEPEAEVAAVQAPGVPGAWEPDDDVGDRRASLKGLPLIDEPAAPDTPLVLDAEPEPVLTETMAELYLRQGLVAEAREVYEKLLAKDPGDARLKAKLDELRQSRRPAVAYAASATGGLSVRAMLLDILAANPAGGADARDATGTVVEAVQAVQAVDTVSAAPATPPTSPTPPTPPPEPMDEAFSEEPAEQVPTHAPTQPASDEVSLAAIFGEAPSPAPPEQPAAQSAAPTGRAPGGFSFDEFFGKPAGTTSEATADRPARDTLADDEGDEAFKDWLKSLKS